MVLVAIGFIVFLFFVAPKYYSDISKQKENVSKFSSYLMVALTGTLFAIALVVLFSRTIIPSDECIYSFSRRIEVIPIGYNESMPPANFIFSNDTYRFIPKAAKDDPVFSTIESSSAHINYIDDEPAYVEVYEVSGFKHTLTWVYGAPEACDYSYYEVYAPKNTIQNVQSSE